MYINLDKGGIDQFFTYIFIIIFKYFELFRFAQLFFKQNYQFTQQENQLDQIPTRSLPPLDFITGRPEHKLNRDVTERIKKLDNDA